jgi:hypothetical protein
LEVRREKWLEVTGVCRVGAELEDGHRP